MTLRRPSVFGGATAGAELDRWGMAKLRQLEPPVPIGGPHHHDVDLNTFEPVDAIHPRSLDRRLAFAHHAEGGETSDSGCKVVDDNTHMIETQPAYTSFVSYFVSSSALGLH